MEDTNIINIYMNGMCRELAREINKITGKPIYAIRDGREKKYIWGFDYWHTFIRVDNDLYLDCTGLNTGDEIRAYWAIIYNDTSIMNYGIIEEVDEQNNVERDPLTKNIASYLSSKYI